MNTADRIKLIRREILVSLKAVYPAAFKLDTLFRSLLGVFPELEFDTFRQDVAYLQDKGYIERKMPRSCDHPDMVPWRERWFELTASGVEIADRVRRDAALEID